jgi:putative transposase
MKQKKRYSHEEIARILEAVASTNHSVEEFCRAQGVHPQTYYGWKKKFDGMSGDDVQRLRQIEHANGIRQSNHR